jgi:hypothetical protein
MEDAYLSDMTRQWLGSTDARLVTDAKELKLLRHDTIFPSGVVLKLISFDLVDLSQQLICCLRIQLGSSQCDSTHSLLMGLTY